MSVELEQIGRYRIERVLGRGAMGVVYQAHDPEIERAVAIKLVRSDLLDGEERQDYLARFRREAQAVGRCAHPNIVALYDYAVHEGNPYLVLEYVQGVSLSQVLRGGSPMRVEEAVAVMLQVLDALSCAHNLGVIHRDIKPANILIAEGGRVKVTDFGISRIGGLGLLTMHGSVVGTPSYMSPEQCRGEEVDARSDLFSAGAVLYEMVAGERAFRGNSFTEVTFKVLEADAPSLQGRVPEPVAAVISRALAKTPDARFASAAEMAAALRGRTTAPVADATVVDRALVSGNKSVAALELDEAQLTTLQRRLAHHIGPIAKMLVSSAIRKAADFDTLCHMLAQNIGRPEEREAFLREVGRDRGSVGSSTRARTQLHRGQIAPAVAELAQKELTRIVGPIARVLVRQAAERCASVTELWETLSRHIESPSERDAFMRLRPSDQSG
jgi:serine/threonine-protein kinase